MRYLNENIKTLEELKKAYHRLCLKLHPDVGGSDEEMKILNADYETPQEFQWLIAELLKLDGIEIEIIGCFVWITGDTKPHKERLKALGFRWHSKKRCWYKSPDGYRRWGKGEYTMDEIRGMYSSMKIHKEQQQREKDKQLSLT